MQFNKDITERVTKLAAQGQEIAVRQEAGMSETPLTNIFNDLRSGKTDRPVEIALVGLDEESVPRVLTGLLGQDYPLCRVVIPDRLGYTEIHLREQGFIFENNGERREFAQADGLLKAIELSRSSGETQNLWSDPVRLSMQAPAGRSGVVLLIPASLKMLGDKPALLSIIASRASILVIAGKSDAQLAKEDRLTLSSLLENLVGLQCVITDEAAVSPEARAKISWLSWPGQAYSFSPHYLSAPESSPFLPFLETASPMAGFKDYLNTQRALTKVEETLGLLDESIGEELDQLANRQRLVDSGVGPGASAGLDAEVKPGGDDIKNRIQEDLDTIKKNREDSAKRSLLVDGELTRSLATISQSLRIDDIEKTPRETVVKLSLAEDKQAEITEALQREVRAAVLNDLSVIEETVTATREEAESQLEGVLGLRTRLHLDPIDRSTWWDSVVSMAKPEIRYRSEMPVMTLGKRFSEARGGLSLVMLAGGLLTGLQAFVDQETLKSIKVMIYTAMIPMLIGGLVWTFISVKKKDRITLDKELEQLREGVLTELRKVAGELLRVQSAQIASLLGRMSKQLNTQATELLKKNESQIKGAREEEARRARERNKGNEQRTREKNQQRTELSRLKTTVSDIRRMLGDWVRSQTSPAGGGAAPRMSTIPGVAASPSRVLPSVAASPSRVLPPT
ncbi:MAG: hypothetical protein ACK5TH_21130 [Prosthecobacter sp.]